MKKNYGSVARGVARVSVKPPRPVKVPKAKTPRVRTRPYVRQPRAPKPPKMPTDLTTQTPTMTGTGVTTTSGGGLPGAPDPVNLPSVYQIPNIKNWNKANPSQIAQAMLAPQYASLAAQQHQAQLMAGQQQSAITSYGAELAKILGTPGPGGQLPTLGPNYAAALSMANLRQFAYSQFLESQKYADEYQKIAAQYPTYLNQILAQKAQQQLAQDEFHLKQASFALQQQVAKQTYGLNVAKTKAYNQATADRSKQAWARIGISGQNAKIAMARYGLSAQQLKLQIAKENRIAQQYNQSRADKNNQIDVSASRAAGRWISKSGKPLNLPYSNPIQTGAKASGSSSKAGSAKRPGGLTPTQYRNAYGDALGNAKTARAHGVSRAQFLEQAVINHIPRSVAAKAWANAKPKPYPKSVGSGQARVGG